MCKAFHFLLVVLILAVSGSQMCQARWTSTLVYNSADMYVVNQPLVVDRQYLYFTRLMDQYGRVRLEKYDLSTSQLVANYDAGYYSNDTLVPVGSNRRTTNVHGDTITSLIIDSEGVFARSFTRNCVPLSDWIELDSVPNMQYLTYARVHPELDGSFTDLYRRYYRVDSTGYVWDDFINEFRGNRLIRSNQLHPRISVTYGNMVSTAPDGRGGLFVISSLYNGATNLHSWYLHHYDSTGTSVVPGRFWRTSRVNNRPSLYYSPNTQNLWIFHSFTTDNVYGTKLNSIDLSNATESDIPLYQIPSVDGGTYPTFSANNDSIFALIPVYTLDTSFHVIDNGFRLLANTSGSDWVETLRLDSSVVHNPRAYGYYLFHRDNQVNFWVGSRWFSQQPNVSIQDDKITPHSVQLRLFPNPTNGWLQVRVPVNRSGGGNLVILDVLGREVGRVAYSSDYSGSVGVQLPGGLASGQYYVKVDGVDGAGNVVPVVVVK